MFNVAMLFIALTFEAQASIDLKSLEAIQNNLKSIYQSQFADRGAELKFDLKTNSEVPNAYARKDGKYWIIEVTEPLLKIDRQNPRTLALMLCHEIGHFLGGEPFVVGRQLTPAVRTRAPKEMSCEGQADYFASATCFRELTKKMPELLIETEDGALTNECYLSFTDRESIEACRTGIQEARELSFVYEEMNQRLGVPMIFQDRFDNAKADRTLNYVGEYPTLECRYQTMVMGMLCPEFQDGDCLDLRFQKPSCWFQSR